MNTYTSRKQNLMIGRVLKIYLIKTRNKFKFDLWVLSYKQISISDFRGKLEKLDLLLLHRFCLSDLINPVSVWKDYSSFSKLPVQKTVKDSMFLSWVSESIRIVIWSNSQFKFCTRNFAKSEFIVNVEKLIWQTQEVMAELRIVLDSRTKTFLH